MSKILKGTGKIFKKAIKTVAKIAPYAVLAGAVIFSGGAALGISGMAGGWSAASASVGSMFGPTFAPIISGAVHQAGIGSLVGGAVAGASGKNIAKGLRTGAAIGGASGALTGLLAPGAVPTQTLSQARDAAVAPTATVAPPPGPAVATNTASGPTPPPTSGAVPARTSFGDWANNNPVLASSALNAAGTGLLVVAQGGEGNAAEERADEVRENYGLTSNYTGLMRPDQVPTSVRNRPRPEDRFSYSFEVQWNPATRRLEKVSTAA